MQNDAPRAEKCVSTKCNMAALLVGDVEDSVADVVRRRLLVAVDEAAAPAAITH